MFTRCAPTRAECWPKQSGRAGVHASTGMAYIVQTHSFGKPNVRSATEVGGHTRDTRGGVNRSGKLARAGARLAQNIQRRNTGIRLRLPD